MAETRQLDDSVETLVPRAQRGDAAAFEELVRRCYQQIYRWALSHTGDADDADDVTQEVLVRMHHRLSTYRGHSRFSTWLYQVTRNASLEAHRRRTRRERLLRKHDTAEGEPEPAPGHDGERIDTSKMVGVVRAMFEALPAGQRRIFDLADLQGFTPKDIGELLGMNAVTVRAHLCKARRAIRRKILEQHPQLVEELRS